MAMGTIQREGVCKGDGGMLDCVCVHARQYVTVCDCRSVCKWEVCGVEMP